MAVLSYPELAAEIENLRAAHLSARAEIERLVSERSSLEHALRATTVERDDHERASKFLKERRDHYRAVVERVEIVLRAAVLLGEESIKTRVVLDAVEGHATDFHHPFHGSRA